MTSVLREGKETRKITHTNDECVGCGICSDICPTSALNLGPILPIARGILEMDYINMNHDKCVLCGLCSFACPFDAIDFEINGENAKKIENYPKWNCGTEITKDDCIYCGKCEIYCPRDAIAMKRNLPNVEDLVMGETRTEVDKCINCRICVEMCPAEAITIKTESEKTTKKFTAKDIEIDKSKCMYCKICQKVCPEDAIKIICTSCMDIEQIPEVTIDGALVLDEEICVNCGWCEKICPTEAAHTKKPFEGEVILNENEEEDLICKGDSCHACQDVCPCNAITIVDNKSFVNQEVCVLCGACAKACPQKILNVNRTVMNLDNIKSASWQKILGSIID
ncbi:NADH-quinone oxidoreductase subunit I [Methanobrevibacter cuticularis]|uniref:NADH-quinone oxidoreductase subunit I n=1 Tax=Methanobrevibacter cuticularis TaxID=47311 RepID=A0A166CL70_9EURY|nr:tungsten-dependent formylmethanofuran dehydrogenase subunit FwdF [Methanobrevibacter cuticularis]KZX15187.1 NADH-quinone oxidoreductase subunit I [Methanobrevibacter cuticularis]